MTETIDLAEAVFDASLSIEQAIHIQTMLAGNRSDAVREAIDDGDFDGAAPLLGMTPKDFREVAKDDDLGYVLRAQHGWLIAVSAPKHGPWSTGKFRSCSVFGGYRVERWFRGDTYELALAAGLEWVQADGPEFLHPGASGGEDA